MLSKFYKTLAIFVIVISPMYLLTKDYTMFFLNLFIGMIILYFVNKGIYNRKQEIQSPDEFAPSYERLHKKQYKYIDVNRNGTYAKYIDYLKKEYEDYPNVYTYEIKNIPCELIPRDEFYDVQVTTPLATEIIGTIPRSDVSPREFSKGNFELITSGGPTWKTIDDENYNEIRTNRKRNPYKMQVKVEYDPRF